MPLSSPLPQSGWSLTQDAHLCVCACVSVSLPAPLSLSVSFCVSLSSRKSLSTAHPIPHSFSLGIGHVLASGAHSQALSVSVSLDLADGVGHLLWLFVSFQGVSPRSPLCLGIWAPLCAPGISALSPVAPFHSSHYEIPISHAHCCHLCACPCLGCRRGQEPPVTGYRKNIWPDGPTTTGDAPNPSF